MNVYHVSFKDGSFSNDTHYVLAADIIKAAKKAEEIRKEHDYPDITSISLLGEVTE